MPKGKCFEMDIRVAATACDRDHFVIQDAWIDEPRPDEILVRIVGVGVCHTDLFFQLQGIIPAPAVLGHEGAGVVERVGADVTKVAPGDHVILTFRSCGSCTQCGAGQPAYCATMQELNYRGARPDGSKTIQIEGTPVGSSFFGQSSFATYALAYETNVVKIRKDVDLAMMGPLACSVQTGVGAILRSMRCEPGSSIVISGGGAVGLSAVMGARLAGCARILLVEPIEGRRELALEFGATHVIDPNAVESLGGHLRALVPGGLDFGFDTTGVPQVQNSILSALRTLGTLGIVGVSKPGERPPGSINDIVARGLTIRGIIEGDSEPDTFLPYLIDLHRDGQLPFDRMVQVFPFTAINDAIEAQRRGTCPKILLALEP